MSSWLESPGTIGRRAPSPGDREADVAIVGGGYTGLWTAPRPGRLRRRAGRRRHRRDLAPVYSLDALDR